MIGFFVNTLVLRTDLSRDPSFRDLLSRVRNVALDAYDHQDLPFEKLVEELRPARDLSRTPIFQVLFSMQSFSQSAPTSSGLTLTRLDVDNATSKFDLSLYVWPEQDRLSGRLEYSTDLFDAATIDRMVEHFQILLDGIAVDPGQRLSALPLLSELEREQVLMAWNASWKERPRECLHELLAAQAARTPEPDAVALVFEDQRLTYRELDTRANRLARHLRGKGVGPEVLVGIFVERSVEMVLAVLGVLKAGGAYVPLDPAHPKERIAFVLDDARVRVLLTQERLALELPSIEAEVIYLDRDGELDGAAVVAPGPEEPAVATSPEHLAYVISGVSI